MAMADLAADCSRQITHFDNTQVSRDFWNTSSTCLVSIHPRDVFETLVYRDYLITNKGLVMVFNSYGPGSTSQTTGAREFYFFPRPSKALEFSYEQGRNEVKVKFNERLSFVFDGKTAQVKGLSEGAVIVDTDVNKNNKGGVEIEFYNGLWLDVGFTMGHSPSEKPRATSTFTDENGQTCTLANEELFTYANGDVDFKYSDSDLKKYLNTTCPNLQISF